MIEQTYPAPVKPTTLSVLSHLSPVDLYHASKRDVSVTEFNRRDRVIKKLADGCKLKVGDTCYPVKLKDYEQHGAFIVGAIATSYKDMGADEKWPLSGDNPLIVSLRPLKAKGSLMFCTTNWIVAKNPHLVLEC